LKKKQLLCRKRFLVAIEYFTRLKDQLAMFGIEEKDEISSEAANYSW
jgi:hypothetical protein